MMPLLENIVKLKVSYPSEWVLRDVEGKVYAVRFTNGKLIVRKDNKYTGKEIMNIEFPNAKWAHYMSTEAMLAHTGFRTNHDATLEPIPEVHCG